MARYVCKNMDEVNYIIKKFNLTFRNYTLTAIIKNIKIENIYHLCADTHFYQRGIRNRWPHI